MNTIIPDLSARAGGMLGLSRRLFCPRSSLLSRWRCGETLPAPPSSVWRVVRVPTATATPLGRTYAKKAAKKRKGGGGGSLLTEEERDVLDLPRIEAAMQASIAALKREYTHNLVTRLTPASLDNICVSVEGQNVPLRQLGQVGMPNPNTLVLNLAAYPQAIEVAVDALRSHTLNLNPIVDGHTIKVPLPKMSKELRESMVKQAKVHAEKAKVGVRKVRQKAISDLRREGASEDTTRKLEKYIQQVTEENTENIEEILKAKSKDLLKVS